MVTRTASGLTMAIAVVAVALTTLMAKGVERDPNPKLVDRIPASLVRLSAGKASHLKSKEGLKFIVVERFDDHVLKVEALSPTELQMTALKAGWTELQVTYENGDTELLVYAVKESP